jgi:hypothetical protein
MEVSIDTGLILRLSIDTSLRWFLFGVCAVGRVLLSVSSSQSVCSLGIVFDSSQSVCSLGMVFNCNERWCEIIFPILRNLRNFRHVHNGFRVGQCRLPTTGLDIRQDKMGLNSFCLFGPTLAL